MHNIELTKQAAKNLEKIYLSDRTLYKRFLNAFDAIAQNPSIGKPLWGKLRGLLSYRMGSYRVLYEIRHRKLLVIIIDLGHRKAIYQ